jgi:hypothetical protein
VKSRDFWSYSYQIQVKNVVSAFRGELKKAALPICIEYYKLDSKYYDKDHDLKLLENGGDPRVAAAAKAALKDDSYLAGPPDCNVWNFGTLLKYPNTWIGLFGKLYSSSYGGTYQNFLFR